MDGHSELMRARLADGVVRPLTDTPEREESWPYWSDGARRLVFQVSSELAREESDLAVWEPEGGERPLVQTAGRDERWPVWSPSGNRLLYAFRGGMPPSGLFMLVTATGRGSVVARSGEHDYYLRPQFSPSGRRIVVQRRGPAGHGSHLWILERGAPPLALAHDPEAFDFKAWFTADGERVVFSRRPLAGGPHDIVLASADGSGQQLLASEPGSDDHSARPSPVRAEIAFVSDRAGTPGVYLADLAGGPARVLRDDPGRAELAPRWSPDGERLVLTSGPPDAALRLVDPESLEDARVVALDRSGRVLFEAPGLMPDWMPPWP